MKRAYSEELKRVQNYLNSGNKRQKYKELQKMVKDFLVTERMNSRLQNSIRSVFSREDVDNSNPIKTDKKIAIKLHKWRSDPKFKQTKLQQPQDIHDIGGISVICLYPSDLIIVSEFLEQCPEQQHFKFEKPEIRTPNENGGYFAYHCVVCGRGKYLGLRCEIQIKTELMQAWGGKTHDLIYKPQGAIDPRLAAVMEKLNQTIQLLDEQSEIMKSMITEAWNLDVQRKKVARSSVVSDVFGKIENDKDLKQLLSFYKSNEQDLALADLSEPIVSKYLDELEGYEQSKGLNLTFCKLVAIFGSGRNSHDLNDYVLDRIDELHDSELKSKTPSEEILKIITLRSLAALALAEYEEAVESGREAFEYAIENCGEDKQYYTKRNLAYFISEAVYYRQYDIAVGGNLIDTSNNDAHAKEALDLVEEFKQDPDLEAIPSALDTIGSVKINCGENLETVREGLDFCTRAFQLAQDTNAQPIVKMFFDLHERRAMRRLIG